MAYRQRPANRVVQHAIPEVVPAATPAAVPAAPKPKPFIAIALPPDGCTLARGTTLTVRMDVPDDSTIAKIELFHDEVKVGEETAAPWRFIWSVPVGEFMLMARATLKDGSKRDSQIIVVHVP